ncbi:13885_t:CDS:1, partial [Dentiscutata erythropus]
NFGYYIANCYKKKSMIKRIKEIEITIKTETSNFHIIRNKIIKATKMIEVKIEVKADPEIETTIPKVIKVKKVKEPRLNCSLSPYY